MTFSTTFLYKNKVYKNIRLRGQKLKNMFRLENIQFLRKSNQNTQKMQKIRTQKMQKIRTCKERFYA